MYGLVLAAAMSAGASSPELFFRHHGCCGYSCRGCYGCCGYGYGCCGGYGYGCCGGYAYGAGCYGCYGCYGCSGCCGWGGYYGGNVATAYYGCCGYAMAAPVYAPGAVPYAPPPMKSADGTTMAPATVVVKVAKEVTVTVDGKPTSLSAAETTFSTPALDASKTYTYVFKAEQTKDGATKTATKTVTVSAGKKTVVDFTNLDTADANPSTETAKVTIILPGQGKLFVNDVEMAIEGKKTFETPKLTPGKRYYYTVKADLVKEGKTTSETRRVPIEAGKSVTVDFTRSDVLTASR